MEKLYYTQYIEVGPTFDLQLMSEQINVSAGEVDGWSSEFNYQYQVHKIMQHSYSLLHLPNTQEPLH